MGQKQTQEEAVPMEKRATQDEENTVEHTNNAKRLRVTREELFGNRESGSEGEPNHTTQNMELSDSEEEWVRKPKEKTSGAYHNEKVPTPVLPPPPPPQP